MTEPPLLPSPASAPNAIETDALPLDVLLVELDDPPLPPPPPTLCAKIPAACEPLVEISVDTLISTDPALPPLPPASPMAKLALYAPPLDSVVVEPELPPPPPTD